MAKTEKKPMLDCFFTKTMKFSGMFYVVVTFLSKDQSLQNFLFLMQIKKSEPPSTIWKFRSEISWNEASSLCAVFGGTLPAITSRKILLKIIALYFSRCVPTCVAIYIGLCSNGQVRLFSVVSFIQF